MNVSRILVLAGLTALLAACGGNQPKGSALSHLAPEEAVAIRAKERWQHIIGKDLHAAYAFLTPGSRLVMPFQSYAMRLTQAQIEWEGVKVDEVLCEDLQTCKAIVQLDIKVTVPGVGKVGTRTVQSEDWLFDEGQWYFLPGQIQ